MGRSGTTDSQDSVEAEADANLRRSKRKRKPTMHSDFDYTGREIECKAPKTVPRRMSKSKSFPTFSPLSMPPKRVEMFPKPLKNDKMIETGYTAETTRNSSHNTSTSSSYNGQTSSDDSLPLLEAYSPVPTYDRLRLEVSGMNPRQIIDAHYRNLETRLNSVTNKYWQNRTAPQESPSTSGDTSEFVFNSKDDAAAIETLVCDVIDAVSIQ